MITKMDYINKINELFKENNCSKKILLQQIDNYFSCPCDLMIKHNYNIGDDVF